MSWGAAILKQLQGGLEVAIRDELDLQLNSADESSSGPPIFQSYHVEQQPIRVAGIARTCETKCKTHVWMYTCMSCTISSRSPFTMTTTAIMMTTAIVMIVTGGIELRVQLRHGNVLETHPQHAVLTSSCIQSV